jgi:hypothetical protein
MNRLAAPAVLALLATVIAPAILSAQVGGGGRRPLDREAEQQAADTMPSTATRGYQFGVTTFGGGTWQPSGIDAGLLFRGAGPFATFGLGLRAGNFIQNQAVLFGGSQGFFLGAAANARLPLVTMFKVGLTSYPTIVRLSAPERPSGRRSGSVLNTMPSAVGSVITRSSARAARSASALSPSCTKSTSTSLA